MTIELQNLLNQYPDIPIIEALITDCNGVARGKWIPRGKLIEVEEAGLKLPKSALSLDIWGRDVPELAYANGDMDGYCKFVDGSFRPALTPGGVDHGQVLLTMFDQNDEPYHGDPRQVLAKLVSEFDKRGLQPCMAVELEFTLLPDTARAPGVDEAQEGNNALGGNLYALSELDRYRDVLDTLREAFEVQNLPFEGIIKEAAPAQFEINMAHSSNTLQLADTVIRMQRCIRTVAARSGLVASFMPKPLGQHAGNGMHIHCSLLEGSGVNVFNNGTEQGSDLLRYAIAGCLELMSDSMLIFSPSYNGYRRFRAGSHAPTRPNWGWDNRTTALRIPAGPLASLRIEHRVAGADANPYLALAAVLMGVFHGLEAQKQPPEAIKGNAWATELACESLPIMMQDAIERFRHSTHIQQHMNKTFQTIFSATKQQEFDEFQKRVTEFELETYLKM